MHSAGALLVVLSLLSGCRREAEPPADSDDPANQVASSPVEAFFRYGPVDLGSSRASVRERLGEPDSVRARTLTNPHDAAVTDSIFTLHYPDLAVEIYRASYDGKEMLSELVIGSDKYLRPESPVHIGSSAEETRLALGEAERTEGAERVYTCTTCALSDHDVLRLEMGPAGVQRIRVHYWID